MKTYSGEYKLPKQGFRVQEKQQLINELKRQKFKYGYEMKKLLRRADPSIVTPQQLNYYKNKLKNQ